MPSSARRLGLEFGVFGGVGDDVDEVFGGDFGGEGELVEVPAGDDGGVFKLLDGGGGEFVLEPGRAEALTEVAGPVGWRAVPTPHPAGTMTVGWMGMSRTGSVGGVEEELLPLEDGQASG